jgi:hypothetical protein
MITTKAGNGCLYFDGIQGFNTFNPQKIVYNQSKNKPIFTSLKLFNSLIKENIAYIWTYYSRTTA